MTTQSTAPIQHCPCVPHTTLAGIARDPRTYISAPFSVRTMRRVQRTARRVTNLHTRARPTHPPARAHTHPHTHGSVGLPPLLHTAHCSQCLRGGWVWQATLAPPVPVWNSTQPFRDEARQMLARRLRKEQVRPPSWIAASPPSSLSVEQALRHAGRPGSPGCLAGREGHLGCECGPARLRKSCPRPFPFRRR
jgi:hypothetical protein